MTETHRSTMSSKAAPKKPAVQSAKKDDIKSEGPAWGDNTQQQNITESRLNHPVRILRLGPPSPEGIHGGQLRESWGENTQQQNTTVSSVLDFQNQYNDGPVQQDPCFQQIDRHETIEEKDTCQIQLGALGIDSYHDSQRMTKFRSTDVDVQDYHKRCQEMYLENEASKLEVVRLQYELKDERSKTSDLEKKLGMLQRLHAENNTLVDENKHLQGQVEKLTRREQQEKEEKLMALAELQNMQERKTKALISEEKRVFSKVSDIQNENEDMERKLEQTQKELDNSKKEIEQLKEELGKARQDTGESDKNDEQFEASNKEQEFKRIQEKHDRLQDQNNKLVEENKHLQEQVEKLNRTGQNKVSQLDSCEKEIERLQKELTKPREDTGGGAKSNNDIDESRIPLLMKEIEDLKTSSESSRQKLQEQIDLLQQKIKDLGDQKSAVEKELKSSKERESNKDAQVEVSKQEQEIKRIQEEHDSQLNELNTQLSDAQKKISSQESLIKAKNEGNTSELIQKITALQEDNDAIRNRLSKMAGAKLLDGNPNIADLSDENRPTKLGEKYSELYDNEWTDAFEEQTDICKESDEQGIQNLLTVLMKVHEFCQNLAKKYLNNLTQTVRQLPGYKGTTEGELAVEKIKLIKDLRKSMAAMMIDNVCKACNDDLTKQLEKEGVKTGKQLPKYIQKCVELCWLMSVQDPPVVIDHAEQKAESPYNADFFKHYTRTGDIMEYVVWPPLFLQKGGPMLSKGVAQAKKK